MLTKSLYKKIINKLKYSAPVTTGREEGEGAVGHGPTTFFRSKNKNGKQRGKKRVSKQKLLKDCHQGQNVTVLAIVERLEFLNLSCRPTIVADNTF